MSCEAMKRGFQNASHIFFGRWFYAWMILIFLVASIPILGLYGGTGDEFDFTDQKFEANQEAFLEELDQYEHAALNPAGYENPINPVGKIDNQPFTNQENAYNRHLEKEEIKVFRKAKHAAVAGLCVAMGSVFARAVYDKAFNIEKSRWADYFSVTLFIFLLLSVLVIGFSTLKFLPDLNVELKYYTIFGVGSGALLAAGLVIDLCTERETYNAVENLGPQSNPDVFDKPGTDSTDDSRRPHEELSRTVDVSIMDDANHGTELHLPAFEGSESHTIEQTDTLEDDLSTDASPESDQRLLLNCSGLRPLSPDPGLPGNLQDRGSTTSTSSIARRLLTGNKPCLTQDP